MPPRRKSTKKDSDQEESSPKPEMKAKRKKRRIVDRDATTQHPKSTALLQPMVDMPIDVLLEVFKHLELVDLWHLSQTSKLLRSILRSRTTISVWKQAIANDGLPQCTEGITEPQLAGLIFGKSCDWCGRNVSGQEIIWAARVRACKRCIELAYKQDDRYSRKYPAALAELVPSIVIRNKRLIDRDLDRQYCADYLSKKSEDEKAEWLEAQVAERRVIYEHATACQEWYESRLEHKVMLRKDIIIERLKEMGWEEELNKLTSGTRPTDLPEVVKACQSELTEPIVAGLGDVLIKFMERTKAIRLDREKKEFFKHELQRLREISREYSLTLPPNKTFPNTADIYFHPVVHRALSAVKSHEMLEKALSKIRPSLPEIVDDCLKLSRQALTDLVIDEYTRNNKPFDLSILGLAATLFRCEYCTYGLTLDQAVAHECRYIYDYSEDANTKAVRNAINEVSTMNKIRITITFSLARLESFVSVLQTCGIDPNTTTVADMNAIDPVMECLACSNPERGRVTMRWFSVSKHIQSSTHSTSGMSILDEPEAEFVRGRILEQYQKDTARTESKDHICAHCRDSGGSMTLMRHVKQDHHIDSPVYGQDVVVSPRVIANRGEFILWPPKL